MSDLVRSANTSDMKSHTYTPLLWTEHRTSVCYESASSGPHSVARYSGAVWHKIYNTRLGLGLHPSVTSSQWEGGY